MTASALTVDGVRQILGREVEEICLTVAKSSALGLDPDTIAHSIGVSKAEIEELVETQDYKDVRLLVGAQMLQEKVDRDTGWDGIENAAVKKLQRRTELENDTDTLLRIAAVANRATRRTAPPKESGVLDPSQAGARVPLTLTRRYTERLGADGSMERSETQQISVLNGSAINPKFEDVRSLLSAGAADCSPIDSPIKEPIQHRTETTRYQELVGDNGKPFTMDELVQAARRAKR